MIACLDVGYGDNSARAACVVIKDWEDSQPVAEHVQLIDDVQDYQPGEFFRRELPCLQAVLAKLDHSLNFIIVDGYVWLDADNRPGLGAHLFETFDRSVPVIGVAKNAFKDTTHAKAIWRGDSKRPLYVTAAGVSVDEAVKHIKSMHGPNRLPTVLKRVDQLSRESINSDLTQKKLAINHQTNPQS